MSATRIEETVVRWPGVVAGPHRFAGREFALGGREVGHVHGDHQVDVPFAKRIRDVVIAEGRTDPHHLFPDSGWVTKYLRTGDDVEEAIWLLRVAYLHAAMGVRRRPEIASALADLDVAAELDALDPSEELRAVFAPGIAG